MQIGAVLVVGELEECLAAAGSGRKGQLQVTVLLLPAAAY
jgi:hypothetical protein